MNTNGAPVALGLMLQSQLAAQPKVLFCPGSDQPLDADAELAKVGRKQTQCGYFYRHAGATQLFDPPGGVPTPEHIKLDSLGLNRNGQPVRALAMDVVFLCPPSLAPYDVKTSTHHGQKQADILMADGHVVSRPNVNGQYTVNLGENADLGLAYNMILDVFEQADTRQ